MKNLITALAVGGALFASTAQAQHPLHPSQNGTVSPLPKVGAAPVITASFASKSGKSESIRQWADTSATGILSFTGDGEIRGAQGETFTQLGYYQHFTTSVESGNARLDSVRILLYGINNPAKFSNGQANKGMTFMVAGLTDGPDGAKLIDLDKIASVDGNNAWYIAPSEIKADQWKTYTVKFGKNGLPLSSDMKEFAVLVSRGHADNQVAYGFDRNATDSRELSNEDRSYFFAVNDNGTSHLDGSMSGQYADGQKVLHPNMIIEAFVHDAQATADVNANVPSGMRLAQNYPNTFSAKTRINFSTPSAGRATLKVFGENGSEIATLVDLDNMLGGEHSAMFDGSNLASGTYTYVLEWNGNRLTKQMTLAK